MNLLFYNLIILILINFFKKPEDQLNVYITFTNSKVHKIILDNLNVNRHVQEEVKAPRYCPSVESKSLKYLHNI